MQRKRRRSKKRAVRESSGSTKRSKAMEVFHQDTLSRMDEEYDTETMRQWQT